MEPISWFSIFCFPPEIFVSPIFLSKLHFTQFYSLGVTPDFLGNLFWHTLPKLAPTRKAAVTALFQEMRQWYQDNGVENRLLTLTELMIRKKANSSPKLRSKAAEARALVPFGVWFLTCALTISIFVFLLEGNSLWSFLFFLKGEFLFGSVFCFSPAKVCSEALDWWHHGRSDYHCMCWRTFESLWIVECWSFPTWSNEWPLHQILFAIWIFGTKGCMLVDSQAKVSPISRDCAVRFQSFKDMVLQRRRLWRIFGTNLQKERRIEFTKGCCNSCFAKI